MRKVIGFKLALRPAEAKRRAKKARVDLGAHAAGRDDAALQRFLDEAVSRMKPGVLFETFKHPDVDQPKLSPMPGLAYSLVLATLGTSEPTNEEEPLKKLIEGYALDECIRFATTILEDEAAKDSCELSPITSLAEPDALETAVAKLSGAKIGVSTAEGRLLPQSSTAVSLSWLSKTKAKKK